jgi:hypothetical protein
MCCFRPSASRKSKKARRLKPREIFPRLFDR